MKVRHSLIAGIFCLFLGTTSAAFSAHAGGKKTPMALAEFILVCFNKGEFAKVHGLMASRVRALFTAEQLAKATKDSMGVTGKYIVGSIQKRSHKKLEKHEFYTFFVSFEKDRGNARMVLNAKGEVAAFTIRTPKLVEHVMNRIKNSAVNIEKPKAATMTKLEGIVDSLMTGFNKNDRELFCKSCSEKMKKAFSKKRFTAFQKGLTEKVGAYVSREFAGAQKSKKRSHLILWYKIKFAKMEGLFMRVVFDPKGGSFSLVGLQFTRRRW